MLTNCFSSLLILVNGARFCNRIFAFTFISIPNRKWAKRSHWSVLSSYLLWTWNFTWFSNPNTSYFFIFIFFSLGKRLNVQHLQEVVGLYSCVEKLVYLGEVTCILFHLFVYFSILELGSQMSRAFSSEAALVHRVAQFCNRRAVNLLCVCFFSDLCFLFSVLFALLNK